VTAFVMLKESLYLAYFYLTGMDITMRHVYSVSLSGIIGGLLSAPLIPLISGFLLRNWEHTFVGKRLRRQNERRRATGEKPDPAGLQAKGGG